MSKRKTRSFVMMAALLSASVMSAGAQDPRTQPKLDEPTKVAIRAILDSAQAQGIPVEPLKEKMYEGLGKGADGPKIVAAVRNLALEMSIAHSALGAVVPNTLSLVVLMGLASRRNLAESLRAHGWAQTTPAAIVCGVSTVDEWIWIGTVAELGTAAPPPGIAGVLVIGDVVRVREALRGSAAPSGDRETSKEVKYGRS